MLLGSTSRNDLLAPGPLTTHHAQVIHRDQWQQRCSTCHPGANDSSLGWIGRAAGLTNPSVTADELHVTQSSLCLNCHETLKADLRSPLLAHGLSAELLETSQRSTNANQSSIRQVSIDPNKLANESDGSLACTVCHQEHHGANHDLLAMSDSRCQSCHQQQFQGFATDHPKFTDWPLTGSTRIAFSHRSHQGTHFLKANQAFDCRVCHQEDSRGDLTARPTYQQACGSCHDAELRESFTQGISLASLPSIDENSLTEAGLPTYEWPAQARNDFDGQLPALLKILLAADPTAAKTMASLGEDFSFFDIDPDNAEQVAKAVEIMAAIRTLLDEIQEEGHDAIGYRLRQVSGKDQLNAELTEYVANLPIEYNRPTSGSVVQFSWYRYNGYL